MIQTSCLCVCIKPVWRTDVQLRLDDAGRGIRHEEALPAANPADLSALQLALSLKGAGGAGAFRVVAITLGSPAAEEVLREALAAGADEAHRIWDNAGSGVAPGACDGSAETTHRSARVVATVVRPWQAHLILVGEKSADDGHESFGAYLAKTLGAAFSHRVTAVTAEGSNWRVVTRLERGYSQEMVLPAPAVVSVSAQMPRPDYASLPAWLHARRARIPVISVDAPRGQSAVTALRVPVPRVKRYTVPGSDLSAEARIQAMVTLEGTGSGTILAGETPQEGARAIVTLLEERGYLRS